MNTSTIVRGSLLLGLAVIVAACGETPQPPAESVSPDVAQTTVEVQAQIESNPLRDAYFGDTHVHTVLSFDAYLMGTRRTPSDAYDFAKGEAIEHASGFVMQMKKPLDFLAVSDHGFYLGMMRELGNQQG
ncbi:MAG: hypothetical protein ACI9UU_003282, partial [Candidatus Azotimanducaceae bacterium]